MPGDFRERIPVQSEAETRQSKTKKRARCKPTAGPDAKRKPRKERTALPVGIIQKTIKQLNEDLTAGDVQTDPGKRMDTRHRISTATQPREALQTAANP